MRKLYHILISLCFAVALTACDLIGNIDKVKPQHQLEEGNAVTDAESAETLVRNVYTLWRQSPITSMRTQMGFWDGTLIKSGASAGGAEYLNNSLLATDPTLEGLYLSLYKVVNAANVAIELISEASPTDLTQIRKSEMLAECRFHRGMAHFYLLRHFGQFYNMDSKYGIIIRTIPARDVETMPRASVADSYAAILADLNDAGNYAPEQVTDHCDISRLTAKALKAKVLLCMQDYKWAESVADSVIREAPSKGYILALESADPFLDAYTDIFIDGYKSKEVLFAPYTFGYYETMETIDVAATTYTPLVENYANELGTMNWLGVDVRFYDSFVMGALDLGGGSNDPDEPGTDPTPDEPLPDEPNLPQPEGSITLDDEVMLPEGEGEGETEENYNNKYPYGQATTGKQGDTYFYLRLAEVYYIYAEAAARNGKTAEAKTALADVLERCIYERTDIESISDAELFEMIRKQKLMELVTENYEEWFDMIRYYAEGNLTMADLTEIKNTLTSEKQFIFPIPQKALAGNNQLVQNP